ncbi:MAG: hypothetical protein JXR70_08520 [Spirochaetales bacterium]|nr:hypothetical protein [Spirochaetales bacterium]
MEQILKEIRIQYVDPQINQVIKNNSAKTGHPFKICYSQNEELFFQLPCKMIVPSLPIHHEVTKNKPEAAYIKALFPFMNNIIAMMPEVFEELVYFFDPEENLKPCFFKLYKIEDQQYLYLLRLDLLFRPQYANIVEYGDNDNTHTFESDKLFLEANFIPLEKVNVVNNKVSSFIIKQMISETWVGERGRGYFLQGIWIDDELSKFFSKLFLPTGKRTYPYYPFLCKYKTLCQNVIHFSTKGRREILPYLHRALKFLTPILPRIEKELKNQSFSEDLDIFKTLKQNVPQYWDKVWQNLTLTPYLNEQDMKEFLVSA